MLFFLIFPINITKAEGTKDEGLTILTPKQVCQRLPIALAQVKAGSASENLPNEIRKIINSLHRAKEITKKVYSIIMYSVKL